VKPASEATLPMILKGLCLPVFARECTPLATRAVREGLSHEGYLLALAQQEASERAERRVERLLVESKLPRDKSLAGFKESRLPPKARAALSALREGSFLDQATNLVVLGNPGTGKSHLIAGLGQEWVHRGRTVLFSPTFQVVQRLLAAKRDLRLAAELKRLDRFAALLLDDLGYVQQSRDEMEVLFTLIAERYERRSLVITTNLVFSKWDEIFKDPMTTAAAVDRIVHHSVIVELNLKSYRVEEAQQRAAATSS